MQKDATPRQQQIAEINTGIIVSPTERLAGRLGALKDVTCKASPI